MKHRISLITLAIAAFVLTGCGPQGVSSTLTSSTLSGSSTATASSAPASSSFSVPSIYANYKTKDQFTKGKTTYTKNGSEKPLTRYLLESNAGMPSLNSLGEQRILVVPVGLEDDTGTNPTTGYTNISKSGRSEKQTKARLTEIENLFFGEASSTGWQSVKSFYDTSSYGKATLTGQVMEPDGGWYKPGLTPSQLSAKGGSQYLVNQVTTYYTAEYAKTNHGALGTDAKPLTYWDKDSDGYVDTIWMVYSAAIHAYGDESEYWAYVSRTGNSANVSNPKAMCYGWASIDFMDQAYGEGLDAHTFIHETGHIFGINDYYSYDHSESPMASIDFMDHNIGDHCAYSKFAYGWVNPYVVDDNAVITIKPTTTSGECVVLPSPNYNGTAFDEYLMVEFMAPVGLAEKDYKAPYPAENLQGFSKPGLRITHVDARAYSSSMSEVLTTPEQVATAVGLRVTNTPSGRGSSNKDTWQSKNPIAELTLMPASGFDDTNNPLQSGNFVATNASLYIKNYTFDLTPYESGTNDLWCMMPSRSNLWNKAQAMSATSSGARAIDKTCEVGYSVSVLNVTKDECTFVVEKTAA